MARSTTAPGAGPKPNNHPSVDNVRGHAVVPVNVLRRRKATEQVKVERNEKLALERARKPKKVAGTLFKKASAFVQEFRRAKASETRYDREARRNCDVEVDGKVLLAVRLKGSKGIDAKSKKVLHVFRLHEVNTAVLIKASPTNAKMLALVAPYVKYGAPTLKTVRDLVLKRGFACVPEEGTTKGPKLRVPLSSNQVVEDLLGKHGMVCLEDVINELHSAGPNFRETNQTLAPFKLNAAASAGAKRAPDSIRRSAPRVADDGVDPDSIDAIVERMN